MEQLTAAMAGLCPETEYVNIIICVDTVVCASVCVCVFLCVEQSMNNFSKHRRNIQSLDCT